MNRIFTLTILVISSFFTAEASIMVGTGVCDLTPPIGTPSAGYAQRFGRGMVGVHDPLLATAVLIQNGKKQVAFIGVDHLGFDEEMVQEIKKEVHNNKRLKRCEVFISSSHTHSGGGAFMDIPIVGYMLAGKFDQEIRKFYIDQTVRAIQKASEDMVPARIGFGSELVNGISHYRADWPQNVTPPNRLYVIKITSLSGEPLCVLFNFALHPTTLGNGNYLFSADFVGAARKELMNTVGMGVIPIYINGAQAELIPVKGDCFDEWENCNTIGKILAKSVNKLWDTIETDSEVEISTKLFPYTFEVAANPIGLKLPLNNYKSELNLILFNREHAILTVPGELSCVYDELLSQYAQNLGYGSVAFFGLTNDAHGYIITPQAWEHKTKESQLSFGGKLYGEKVMAMMMQLLKDLAPVDVEKKQSQKRTNLALTPYNRR